MAKRGPRGPAIKERAKSKQELEEGKLLSEKAISARTRDVEAELAISRRNDRLTERLTKERIKEHSKFSRKAYDLLGIDEKAMLQNHRSAEKLLKNQSERSHAAMAKVALRRASAYRKRVTSLRKFAVERADQVSGTALLMQMPIGQVPSGQVSHTACFWIADFAAEVGPIGDPFLYDPVQGEVGEIGVNILRHRISVQFGRVSGEVLMRYYWRAPDTGIVQVQAEHHPTGVFTTRVGNYGCGFNPPGGGVAATVEAMVWVITDGQHFRGYENVYSQNRWAPENSTSSDPITGTADTQTAYFPVWQNQVLEIYAGYQYSFYCNDIVYGELDFNRNGLGWNVPVVIANLYS